MKKYVFMLIVLITIMIPYKTVLATRGCCSSHGGVDCSQQQANGNVVCNDGWLGSSCSYSAMVMCSSATSSTTRTTQSYIYGCTNQSAKNYDASANQDDGTCIYYVYGCTDMEAINYNSKAEKDDGSCIEKIYGCMDEKAINYDAGANQEDDSCEYEKKADIEAVTYKENNKEQNDSNGAASIVLTTGTLGALGYVAFRKLKK